MKTIGELRNQICTEIPISSIIKSRIEVRKGSALCPFHEDHSSGSFQFSDKKNIFKCFSCHETGNGIDFVMKFDKITFKEAVLKISYQFQLISQEEYDLRSSSKDHSIPKMEYKIRSLDKSVNSQCFEQIDFIYTNLIDLLPLTDEHRKYLHQRGLTDDDIVKNQYFSFNGKDMTKYLEQKLLPYGITSSNLLGIPGFYYYNKNVSMMKLKGVGIPIINSSGQIIALQVRKDEVKEKEARYIFFSSSKYDYGTSCGTPIQTIYPDHPNKDLFITEGHFKAYSISKTFNSIAISVQGVYNIKNIEEELKDIISSNNIDRILIAYDMDMYKNIEVFKASIKLIDNINKVWTKGNLFYMIWDPDLGKGIDDVIINKENITKIKTVKAGIYQKGFISYVNTVLEKTKLDIKTFKQIPDKIRWTVFSKIFKM